MRTSDEGVARFDVGERVAFALADERLCDGATTSGAAADASRMAASNRFLLSTR
jgi:hypothetical protein